MHRQRTVLLALALLALLVLGGCAPMGPAITPQALRDARQELIKVDRIQGVEKLNLKKKDLQADIGTKSGTKGAEAEVALDQFLLAYVEERLGNYNEAVTRYMATPSSSPYRALALFRAGEVASHAAGDVVNAVEVAGKAYGDAAGFYPVGDILVREPALASRPLRGWRTEPLRIAGNKAADRYRQGSTSYKVIDVLVSITGKQSWSYGLALILIAALVKLITTPLTTRQFKAMREMQAKMAVVQPLIAEMQKKHKGDKEAQMREQMRIYKENNVNPAGGCLSMLIMLVQMPFLIWVFYAIRSYAWPFEGKSFLWVPNLAMPDMVLLVLYAISLYLSQKLTTPPSTDPQQQQMTRMMAIMMPFMLLMFLKNASAAFILYWFAQNVFMTGHQYLLYRAAPPLTPAAVPEKKVVKR